MLTRLRDMIPELVTSDSLRLFDEDSFHDSRDSPEFDSQWVRIHRALQAIEATSPASPDESILIDAISEAAFMQVYSALAITSSFTELAPTVSDDFRLVARAIRLDFHDGWLSGLLSSYQMGTLPTGSIDQSELSLTSLLMPQS